MASHHHLFKPTATRTRTGPKNRRHKAHPRSRAHERASVFTFFRPPAELRNRIYTYVLTSSTGATLRWQTGIARNLKKPVIYAPTASAPLNQLQYINRQLHKEIASLEIQHNRISFDPCPSFHASSNKILIAVTGQCTPTRLR
jgi:hypothetical protein